MTQIDGDYLVTDEASVAVLFRGKSITAKFVSWREDVSVEDDVVLEAIYADTLFVDGDEAEQLFIPRALVLEAIESVEGEPIFFCWPSAIAKDNPHYQSQYGNMAQWATVVAANAITIGKTVGELCKLVEWARG